MGIAIVWTIPIGVVSAITNVTLGLNVITEFIIGKISLYCNPSLEKYIAKGSTPGYMQPGRPL